MLAAATPPFTPVCTAAFASTPQETVLTFVVPMLAKLTLHTAGATAVQETVVAVTCAVLEYVPIRPNTVPARATAAMSVTAMRMTSDTT